MWGVGRLIDSLRVREKKRQQHDRRELAEFRFHSDWNLGCNQQ